MIWRNPVAFRTDDRVETRVETEEPFLQRMWVSLDPGQAGDYSAFCVGETYAQRERTFQHDKYVPCLAEDHIEHLDRTIHSFRIVSLHRAALGTPYPVICEQVRSLLVELPEADLIIDVTGIGRGVFDILWGRGLRPHAITITAGETWTRKNYEIHVAKVQLVSCLIAATQENRVKFAAEIPLKDVISEEIAAFQPRRTATGLLTYEGADGIHDDLVLALSMGIWQQTHRRRDATTSPLRI
jgi:hypothetical protein